MDIAVESVMLELKRMAAEPLSAFSKNRVHELYPIVLNRNFKPTSCTNCYHDAMIEMYTYLKRNGKFMEQTLYKLAYGVVIQAEFGSQTFYTHHNCTDEIAEMLLAQGKATEKDFDKMPKDWRERIARKNDAPAEAPAPKRGQGRKRKG